MKIALQTSNSGWVLDEIAKDFSKYTRHTIVKLSDNPDLIWFIDLFSFNSSFSKLSCKKVLQLHHIDESKISEYNIELFKKADFIIVPNHITEKLVIKHVGVNPKKLPYWLLSIAMDTKKTQEIESFKKKISNEECLIGSFVKDGDGKQGDKPKFAKNPDLFLDILDKIRNSMKIKVVLAGYARNYVINCLKKMKIDYIYFEKYPNICLLYDCLDWYIINSRCEGGPQSILEAPYRNIKVLSTDVGMASEVIHPSCICQDTDDFVNKIISSIDQTIYNHRAVATQYVPSIIIPQYDEYFESLC